MCKKVLFPWLQRKLHVLWETASSDVTQWLSCIVGNVSSMFWTGECVELKWWYVGFFCPRWVQHCYTSGLLFKTWCLHYPQCNLTIEGHHCRLIIRVTELERDFILLFHLCSSIFLLPDTHVVRFNPLHIHVTILISTWGETASIKQETALNIKLQITIQIFYLKTGCFVMTSTNQIVQTSVATSE